jgi:two-component system, chemotaxis family, response regulator Rcp1
MIRSTTARASADPVLELARPARILLVEDSPSDVAMTRAALREGRIANDLSVVSDGERAMAFVRRQGEYAHVARPDLVLLDLNLPKKDGREVLAEMKEDPDLKSIPVVVLTTSAAEADVHLCYGIHANSYVIKPIGVDSFLDAVRGIEDFWLALVRLPDDLGRIS